MARWAFDKKWGHDGSQIFEVQYHGTCASCGEHIEPGDLVRYLDDEVIHEDCYEAPPAAPSNCDSA